MSIAVLQAECKRAVSSLTTLSNDELDEILNNDEKIEEILQKTDKSYLNEIQSVKDSIIAQNESMAEGNLSHEPELVEGREKLQKLYEEGEELSKTVEEKTKQLREKTGDVSLETTLALLQTAASEVEEESDALAKKFMDEGGELDDFLEQFLAKRKLMHLRLIKAEKMAKILSRGMGPSNYINTPPMNLNTNYFPGVPNQIPSSVPYPTGPLNMPMPSPMNYFQNHY